MSDTLFWNVDTQYDFMRETYEVDGEPKEGKLPVPARHIEDNLEQLTETAADYNIRVVNTADWHNEETEEITYDQEEWENDPTKFPPHCMQGTDGAKYVPATRPDAAETYRIDWQDDDVDMDALTDNRNVVLYKDKFNAFDPDGAPHTDTVLDELAPDRAVVYGVATDVCVDFAVNGLLDRGVEVYVVEDAIDGLGVDRPLDEVKQDWEDRGAELVTTDAVTSAYGGESIEA